MLNYKRNRVSADQIAKAKNVDLVKYLTNTHPELIRYDEKSKRYLHSEHDSCVISNIGFYRFSTHDRGDQIQFLENYCNLNFQNAVRALAQYAGENVTECIPHTDKTESERSFGAPEACEGIYKHVWSYLVLKRGLPKNVVEKLFENGTLYQAKEYNNCVFLSDICNYAELVGTTDNKFKQIQKGSAPDGFWCVGNKDSDTVYLCESAIDAISLMLLQEKYNPQENACYASMGGLKDSAVEHLKKLYPTVAIAVDNDTAGKEFREKHTELFSLIPPCVVRTNGQLTKDWNDVLRYCDDAQIIKRCFDECFEDLPF